jgi:hypothetical protein
MNGLLFLLRLKSGPVAISLGDNILGDVERPTNPGQPLALDTEGFFRLGNPSPDRLPLPFKPLAIPRVRNQLAPDDRLLTSSVRQTSPKLFLLRPQCLQVAQDTSQRGLLGFDLRSSHS